MSKFIYINYYIISLNICIFLMLFKLNPLFFENIKKINMQQQSTNQTQLIII